MQATHSGPESNITKNELVLRDNICICGRMNAGKSSLMNLITGQETSIVDTTPGTTADVKMTVMQIHDFGPVKLFDTAGLDETNVLGRKKQDKSIVALKESDLVILVIDPVNTKKAGDVLVERRVIDLAKEYKKQLLIVFNIHGASKELQAEAKTAIAGELDIEVNHPSLAIDLSAANARTVLLDFMKEHYEKRQREIDLLPFLGTNGFVALNIPMDEETPSGRLLRPQHVVLEYVLRHFVPFAGYRMNLGHGRSPHEKLKEAERTNYLKFLDELKGDDVGLQLIITDSQAIDLVHPWTPEDIPLTTFSIVMANHQSNGQLAILAEGVRILDTLNSDSRILIAELCNHDRKAEDIGTKQLPNHFKRIFGEIRIDFAEGRVFPSDEELGSYDLVIQCGGCMVDQQKYSSRINDCASLAVPVTNYGLALAWVQSPEALERVLKPWTAVGIGDTI